MKHYLEATIAGESFLLLPEKAMYWPRRRCLIVADVHLGKVTHFRKHGIPIPMEATTSNEERLLLLLDSLELEEVIILGDLFHSEYNGEWHLLERLTSTYVDTTFHLVEGNHDILQYDQYRSTRLVLHSDTWELGPFTLSHEPLATCQGYNLCGHIHPGVVLRGKGRQYLRLPCFFFGEEAGILPAFGAFTGLYQMTPQVGEEVFAIAERQVFDVSKKQAH